MEIFHRARRRRACGRRRHRDVPVPDSEVEPEAGARDSSSWAHLPITPASRRRLRTGRPSGIQPGHRPGGARRASYATDVGRGFRRTRADRPRVGPGRWPRRAATTRACTYRLFRTLERVKRIRRLRLRARVAATTRKRFILDWAFAREQSRSMHLLATC
jgi:hypothetical protein